MRVVSTEEKVIKPYVLVKLQLPERILYLIHTFISSLIFCQFLCSLNKFLLELKLIPNKQKTKTDTFKYTVLYIL